MTDDLVKRLQEEADCYRGKTQACLLDAKDRIEQLEAALITIVLMTPDPEFGTLPIESAIKVARVALGKKKDD